MKEKSFEQKLTSTNLLFELFDRLIASDLYHEEILIRQLPIHNDIMVSPVKGDVIIHHRGDDKFLQKILYTLENISGLSIYVGIDQAVSEELMHITDRFPSINFYGFSPDPVGPYVIRNRLIELGSQSWLFFHDSDDISCRDRFEKLIHFMTINECDFCGSHELRLDYYNHRLQSVRFPRNAKKSLEAAPWFALLHPSSAIKRDTFYNCGTLSEERIFGNDTKFLLYSYFFVDQIRNVDEFLYIRRIHPGSLTTSEETKLGSPIRRKLQRTWNTDFELVKLGITPLKESSLVFHPTNLDVVMRALGSTTLKRQ